MTAHNASPQKATPAPTTRPPKLLERLRQRMQQQGIATNEVQTCVHWVAAFIRYHGLRHPRELTDHPVAAFLVDLRRDPQTTPQREATPRAALDFLYLEFLPLDTEATPPTAGTASKVPTPEKAEPATPNQPGHAPVPTRSPFLNRCHEILRLRHYSLRTEECYVNWIKRLILFHNKRHPAERGAPEIEAFLTHLAVGGHGAASTQNQAFNALLFLYQQVLSD